jgi:UDP-glucose 4-epimerase
MADVLVTGGAGYVGSVCCAELLRLGHSVTVVDDLSTGFRDGIPREADFLLADIGNRAEMEKLLQDRKFDVVFHFAAKALVPESVVDPGPFFHTNVEAGIVLLEVFRKSGIRKFVFSSSAAVYGIPVKIPIDEDDSKKPVNSYGETKLIFEQILQWYAKSYDWSVFSFRYFNAAGATPDLGERHDPETHIIPLLLQAAAGESEFFSICGADYDTPDGTCLRDFVHVLDIAAAHICALQDINRPGMHIYNIGSGVCYSVRQVCNAVEKVVGHSVPVRVMGRRPGDPAVLHADPRRIIRELNWKPQQSSLEEIISSAWRWKQNKLKARTSSASL